MDVDKRKSYDSVDPKFDESMPDASEVSAKNFYDKMTIVFERNSRYRFLRLFNFKLCMF